MNDANQQELLHWLKVLVEKLDGIEIQLMRLNEALECKAEEDNA